MMTARATLCILLALGLSACVTVFPKAPPSQLYRFGVPETGVQPAAAGAVFNVVRMPTEFERAAEGDRILTIDGDQAAYIADARWETPASSLFDEAETRAFERAGGPARLLRAGDPAAAPISLRLDVQTFEVRYLAGGKAAPTVVVAVHALLVNAADRKILGDQVFESRTPAPENRVSAIVEAFNAATDDVLTQIVTWTDQQGAPAG
jgi:cholesterol transport system auxiliary component